MVVCLLSLWRGFWGTAWTLFQSLWYFAVIGTVLFGTLRIQRKPNAVAAAFSHSAQLALLVNVAFALIALLLVIALPRQIPARR